MPYNPHTKKYYDLLNKEDVRAIRVTEKNFIKLADWVDGLALMHISPDGDESKHRIKVKVPGHGWRVAQVGDFLVKEHDNTIHVSKNAVFHEQYRLLTLG